VRIRGDKPTHRFADLYFQILQQILINLIAPTLRHRVAAFILYSHKPVLASQLPILPAASHIFFALQYLADTFLEPLVDPIPILTLVHSKGARLFKKIQKNT
jgi:hypothetical protein